MASANVQNCLGTVMCRVYKWFFNHFLSIDVHHMEYFIQSNRRQKKKLRTTITTHMRDCPSIVIEHENQQQNVAPM